MKAGKDYNASYIDEELVESAPRLVRKCKRDHKEELERKNEKNENFMEFMKSFAISNMKRRRTLKNGS